MKKIEPRRSLVTVAVTVSEKEQIESLADQSNLSTSSFARLILLEAGPITLEMTRQIQGDKP